MRKVFSYVILASSVVATGPCASVQAQTVSSSTITSTQLLESIDGQRDISSFPVRYLTEVGLFYSRNNFHPGAQDIYSLPVAFTYFATNQIDVKIEGNVNFVDGTDGTAKSGIASIGLSFWPTSTWSLTPMVRFGVERFDRTDARIGVAAADLMSEASFKIKDQTWLVISNRMGYVHREALQPDRFGVELVNGYTELLNNVALDAPAGSLGDDKLRVRLTGSLNHHIGSINSISQIHSVIASLRTVDAKTGIDKWKVEGWLSWGNRDFDRAIVGVSRKF